MFEEDKIIDMNNLLNKDYIFYAHTRGKGNYEKETLQEHTYRCVNHFKSIVKGRNLELVFQNFAKEWFSDINSKYIDFFEEIIINTIVFHDIGKINPLFQKEIMMNEMFIKEKGRIELGTNHSIISAILYLEYYLPRCIELPKDIRKIFRTLIFINAYIISKHHGSLDRFEVFLDSFYDQYSKNRLNSTIIHEEVKKYIEEADKVFVKKTSYERVIDSVKKHMIQGKEAGAILYAYERLIYSLLIASDYFATTEYNSGLVIEVHGTIDDINKIMDIYNSTDINISVENYRNKSYLNKNHESVKDINILRSELYLDAEAELLSNLNEKIFYLEAPTGSGKSNVAFNLSFQLIKHSPSLNKIMYIYPFNTLVEQNLISIEKVFEKHQNVISHISVVNSITPVLKEGDTYDFKDYERALLDRQFFNYPITLSTHVTLFDIMFGNNRESGFAFYQLANSVIVLDEIQSYKNTLWTEIITFLKAFSKILNIKIIIMSATLPDLDILSKEQNKAVKLIRDRDKYFLHPLFKDRVTINYELLDVQNVLDELYDRIRVFLNEGKKILVEFINKGTAINFYRELLNNLENDMKIELLTGDDSNAERARILYELDNSKEGIPFLLIATQVVEAGVDIKNIDVGFKDISILDSEEQFMGRVNRSSKKRGLVFFFNYDNGKTIYKEDIRINDELTLKSDTMRDILKEKRFNEYYEKVLSMLNQQNESFDYDKSINYFFEEVSRLNSLIVSQKMKLIKDNEWKINIFFNREVVLDNGATLIGEIVWNEYKHLINNRNNYSYAEWRVRLSIVKSKMNYFIYQINGRPLFTYSEHVGEIYYIDASEQYFEGGKFIRDKLEKQEGIFI